MRHRRGEAARAEGAARPLHAVVVGPRERRASAVVLRPDDHRSARAGRGDRGDRGEARPRDDDEIGEATSRAARAFSRRNPAFRRATRLALMRKSRQTGVAPLQQGMDRPDCGQRPMALLQAWMARPCGDSGERYVVDACVVRVGHERRMGNLFLFYFQRPQRRRATRLGIASGQEFPSASQRCSSAYKALMAAALALFSSLPLALTLTLSSSAATTFASS